jgi:hypothetical protein
MMLKTHTELATYAECPQRHLYSYALGLEPKKPAPALIRGSLVHRALELFYNTGDAALATAELDGWVEKEREEYRRFYDEDERYEQDVEWRKLRGLVRAYLEKAAPWDLQEYSVVGNEHEFKFEAGPGRFFGGKVDGLFVENATGRLVLFEHKYLWDNEGKSAKVRYQPFWYALGLLRDPELGVKVSEICHNLLKRPHLRLCRGETPRELEERVYKDAMARPQEYVRRVKVEVTQQSLAEAERALLTLYERSMEGPEKRYRNEGPNCERRCPFVEICFEPDSSPERIEELFRVRERRHPELSFSV